MGSHWFRDGAGWQSEIDLEQFDELYFQRLRERVSAAGKRGIYVSVMLFEGPRQGNISTE